MEHYTISIGIQAKDMEEADHLGGLLAQILRIGDNLPTDLIITELPLREILPD